MIKRIKTWANPAPLIKVKYSLADAANLRPGQPMDGKLN
jgi:hypothetical protein